MSNTENQKKEPLTKGKNTTWALLYPDCCDESSQLY